MIMGGGWQSRQYAYQNPIAIRFRMRYPHWNPEKISTSDISVKIIAIMTEINFICYFLCIFIAAA